ncbi:CLUMA_CG010902, isoform A [Clunio marinus]|uniref:CLUMA_CG010902, isoform A n=1 Tax=Clunio marinus TaxID=568069 RepID=A0A1J1IGD4_9DIPT|nr:CLUMA_CG010902, isoform A [Clunio marinus]
MKCNCRINNLNSITTLCLVDVMGEMKVDRVDCFSDILQHSLYHVTVDEEEFSFPCRCNAVTKMCIKTFFIMPEVPTESWLLHLDIVDFVVSLAVDFFFIFLLIQFDYNRNYVASQPIQCTFASSTICRSVLHETVGGDDLRIWSRNHRNS